MSKIFKIIKREYLSRVKKKSFIILTILIPILMAGLMMTPLLLSRYKSGSTSIAVLDKSGLFKNKLDNTDNLFFNYFDGTLEELKQTYKSKYKGILYIPVINIKSPQGIKLYSENQFGMLHSIYIENQLEKIIEDNRLKEEGLDREYLAKFRVNLNLDTVILSKEGEKSSDSKLSAGLSYVMGFMLYIMLLSYGTMIMKGVIEEKKNRIIEVIISSVKPFQLMLGKILGIGAVALTQIIIWLILGTMISTSIMLIFLPEMLDAQSAQVTQIASANVNVDNSQIYEIIDSLKAMNIPLVLSSFIFYFLFGYLIYSALFAAIGSISDDASDNQSIAMPVILPIIISLFIMINVLEQPHSPLAFWSSLIPLFSPIVMTARLPFGVPGWQLALSMFLLAVGFVFSVWMAGKIYRVGILLHGKKVTFKELKKWVFYK
ncbi:MAG: ABC transporter permease [Candidatus Cloacimonetes bacterium]|nr:ABC transporter permease [Candidatus Cloacimonadota bacterium]